MTEAPAEETGLSLEKEAYDFDEEFQLKIVALMLRDGGFASRTLGLIEPQYFSNEADAHLAKIARDYFDKFRKAPDRSLYKTLILDAVAAKKIRSDGAKDVIRRMVECIDKALDISDHKFVEEKVAEFARDRAVEQAILASVEDHGKRDYGRIRKRMEEALQVGLDDASADYDYFDMVEARTEERKGRVAGVILRDGITTGIAELDKELYHGGWGRKELSVMMGAAKAGKSMSLGEFAKNASLAGYNVAYLSCEVAAKIIAERLDANVSGVLMKKLDENAFAIEEAVTKLKGKSGALLLKEYATGTLKCSEVRRLLDKARAKGRIYDLVIVDYADIMAPEHRSDSQIDNMRSIYIDLRAVAFDYDCAVLTATQSNREGAKKMTAGATDVAEDYNKARTVDLMISINANEAEKAAGEARLFFALSRNSESEFTLRIKQDRSRMRFIEKVLGRE